MQIEQPKSKDKVDIMLSSPGSHTKQLFMMKSVNPNLTNKNLRMRKTFQNVKLRIAANQIVNSTRPRMYKNMTNYQKYLINDQTHQIEMEKFNESFQNIPRNSALINFLLSTQEKTFQYAKNINRQIKYLGQTTVGQKVLNYMKKIPVIPPSSVFKLIWDLFLMLFIMLYIFLIPLLIGFSIPFNMLIGDGIAQISPLIFVFDIFICLNTGYFDKGTEIKDKQKIVKHYIQNYFFGEVGSVLPYIMFNYSTTGLSEEDLRRVSSEVGKFTLLLFFFKLKRFNDIMRRLSEITHLNEKTRNLIQLVKLLSILVIIAHILSCVWIYIAFQESRAGGITWIDPMMMVQQASRNQLYIRALYFTIVTMITVGYGDVHPLQDTEYVVCIIVIIISCGVYAFTFSEIGHFIKQIHLKEDEMKENLRVINYYMYKKNISHSLQYQIREYLDYYWKEVIDSNKEKEKRIIGQLSDSLREELQFESNKSILKTSKVFANNFSDRLLQKTMQLIKEYKFNPEQIIVDTSYRGLKTPDDLSNSIYFIEKGSVELYYLRHVPGKPDQYFQVQILEKGQNFGAESFFTSTQPVLNARSKEFTTILSINRDEFLNLLQDFPEDHEQFCQIKDNINLYNNSQQIGVYCPACGSYFHSVRFCPLIHYIPYKEKLIKQYRKENANNERVKQESSRNTHSTKNHTLISAAFVRESLIEYQQENQEVIEYYIATQHEKQQQPQEMGASQEIAMAYNRGLQQSRKTDKKLFFLSKSINDQDSNNQKSFNKMQSTTLLSQKQIEMRKASLFLQQHEIAKVQQLQMQQQTQQQTVTDNLENSQQPSQNQIYMDNFSNNQIQQSTSNLDQQLSSNENLGSNNNINNHNSVSGSGGGGLEVAGGSSRSCIVNNFNQQTNRQIQDLEQQVQRIQDQLLIVNLLKKAKYKGLKTALHDLNQDFECFKNFQIYFPYNNLDYQLQIMQFSAVDRKFYTQRIHLDNNLFNRKTFQQKLQLYKQQMNLIIQKQQKCKLSNQQQQIKKKQINQEMFQYKKRITTKLTPSTKIQENENPQLFFSPQNMKKGGARSLFANIGDGEQEQEQQNQQQNHQIIRPQQQQLKHHQSNKVQFVFKVIETPNIMEVPVMVSEEQLKQKRNISGSNQLNNKTTEAQPEARAKDLKKKSENSIDLKSNQKKDGVDIEENKQQSTQAQQENGSFQILNLSNDIIEQQQKQEGNNQQEQYEDIAGGGGGDDDDVGGGGVEGSRGKRVDGDRNMAFNGNSQQIQKQLQNLMLTNMQTLQTEENEGNQMLPKEQK